MAYSEKKHPRVLILVPTRELVVQVEQVLSELTKYMTSRIIGVYGDTNMNTQKQKIVEGLDVIVATPGRLRDLALTGVLRLKQIQKLVVDEVDEMLSFGFKIQLENIFDLLPEKRQNLLFSATLTNDVSELINQFFRDPIRVEVENSGKPLQHIDQEAYVLPNTKTKLNLLKYFLDQKEEFTKVIVFTGNKRLANTVYNFLEPHYGKEVSVIHSNKTQTTRNLTIKRLAESEIRVLVATDLVARGVDIENVSHVINFDIPDNPESYVHRIGRTGRAGASGKAMAFIKEMEFEFMAAIEEIMTYQPPIKDVPSEVEIIEGKDPEEVKTGLDVNYLPQDDVMKSSQGAFQDKSDKNSKRHNMGLTAKRELHMEKKKNKRKKKR